MTDKLEAWALPRLQQLLPLDDESLKQVLAYADTLPRDAAADHLRELLGDGPRSLEFIEGFNLRRHQAPVTTHSNTTGRADELNTPPKNTAGSKASRNQKKKPNIHALPARQVAGQGDVTGGYVKGSDIPDYLPRSRRDQQQAERQQHQTVVADNMALRVERPPDAMQMPLVTDSAAPKVQPQSSRVPPSAAGPLISDALSSTKAASSSPSQASSQTPRKTKIHVSGGTSMHGASTTLSDLDSAIRTLEIQTNPSLGSSSPAAEEERRKCNCMATRHPLLEIAPNCVNCGKIICVKQGLGPCTFCSSPLLSSDDIAKVLRVLKDERGEERMRVNNAAHKKAEVVSGKPRAFTGREFLAQSSERSSPLSSNQASPAGSEDEASEKAKQHRNKLLGFQAQNARRTQIHDEAADYEVPTAGTNMWASPSERAQQLKRQQKALREMEWNARPEYEKRRIVASIDLHGGKVVRKMAAVEKPDYESADETAKQDDAVTSHSSRATGGSGAGAFSNNPLARGLVKPRAKEQAEKGTAREKRSTWRRVQMDEDDNEAWILDGGLYGGEGQSNHALGSEEHAFG